MVLRKPIVALALCALASSAMCTPNALAHAGVAHVSHSSHITVRPAADPPSTTPATASSTLPIPDVTLTNNTTLTENTILPAGTILLAQTVLPAGTILANGTALLTSVTLQGPVKLDHSITVPAGTELAAGTVLPIDTIIPGAPSFA